MLLTPDTTWDFVAFETPTSWHAYVALGELGQPSFVGEGSVGKDECRDLGAVAKVQHWEQREKAGPRLAASQDSRGVVGRGTGRAAQAGFGSIGMAASLRVVIIWSLRGVQKMKGVPPLSDSVTAAPLTVLQPA